MRTGDDQELNKSGHDADFLALELDTDNLGGVMVIQLTPSKPTQTGSSLSFPQKLVCTVK